MNDAIARIYALQQRELNAKLRQQTLANAKRLREIAAFQNSGLTTIFGLIADVPLRTEVRQRTYQPDFKALTWPHQNPINYPDTKDISLRDLCGNSGPRWWCEESNDSNRMWYCYSSGRSGSREERWETPNGNWLDLFIEYAAHACDTETIARLLTTHNPEPLAVPARRQIQAI